ncbi:MAG TPA: aminoglycoside 3-N-acetyltransferase [Sphingomonas bacterium]|jgi:aminoglycoside 3-N-acetyltransferase|uniref:Aminoglycoside N(3)-acetyltransferase n=1 Tax=Sphingomonas bacterium TaxID=1895847 RepID=A0A3D0WFD2_9SPHN|nr:aminoglycoside 3-N-acetyltransferase [Sphingomonas bacterium]
MRTATDLAADLHALGLGGGETVMAHAGMRSIGPLVGGPDTLIEAIRLVIGTAGTLVVATDWEAPYLQHLIGEDGCVPDEWREHIPPYDPARSRSMRENGAFAEFVRTTPGARRSANPNCSVAAIGARADWLTENQALDYGYGEGSPLAKLIEAGGKVLLVGAPAHSITLLHHAEHLAAIPGKRVLRQEIPLRRADGSVEWRWCEEYESSEAVVPGFDDEYFDDIAADYRAAGGGIRGPVGDAPAELFDAADITHFAVDWLERTVTAQSSAG